MGGGKKKRSMTQMAKAQTVEKGKGRKDTGGRGRSSSSSERKTLTVMQPNPKDKGMFKELKKMKVLTPYAVASRFNLRLGAAKDFLEELHSQGLITYVSGGRNIRIYKPAEKD